MIVDLNQLPYRHVKSLITWCIANDIDKDQAVKLLFQWYDVPPGDDCVWELDIPEEYVTYFMLKWK